MATTHSDILDALASLTRELEAMGRTIESASALAPADRRALQGFVERTIAETHTLSGWLADQQLGDRVDFRAGSTGEEPLTFVTWLNETNNSGGWACLFCKGHREEYDAFGPLGALDPFLTHVINTHGAGTYVGTFSLVGSEPVVARLELDERHASTRFERELPFRDGATDLVLA